MKLTKFIKSIRLAAVGLAMLLGPPVRAQWEANFTGQVTDITDPDGVFQGLVTAGTPVTGYYAYDPSAAYYVPGVYSLKLGSVTVTNYFDMTIYSYHNEPWIIGDLFHFERTRSIRRNSSRCQRENSSTERP
jgi:hypothetical protein